jgi:hypothetical protein
LPGKSEEECLISFEEMDGNPAGTFFTDSGQPGK